MEYLVTFHSHFDAIQYRTFLIKKGITAKLQPVPRKISSSCGVCAVFTIEHPMANVNEFIIEGCSEIFLLTEGIQKIHTEY